MSVEPSHVSLPFQFDPDDLAYMEDPYPTYRYLRQHAPAYYWSGGRAWIFSRYDDVVAILRDGRFSMDFQDWEHAGRRPDEETSRVRSIASPSSNVASTQSSSSGSRPGRAAWLTLSPKRRNAGSSSAGIPSIVLIPRSGIPSAKSLAISKVADVSARRRLSSTIACTAPRIHSSARGVKARPANRRTRACSSGGSVNSALAIKRPNPDTFDIRRDQTANVMFGTGRHHCIGSALARLEGEVAVSTLLERFPAMALAGKPRFMPHPLLRKMASLPVRLG